MEAAVAALQAQVQQLTLQLQQKNAQQPAPQETESMDKDSSISEEQGTFKWEDVLGEPALVAETEGGRALTSLLASAPPLESVKSQMQHTPRYTSIPQTPPARKNPKDFPLALAQQKIEHVMHLLVHHTETRDDKQLAIGAALARSAWEDLHQARRQSIAGKSYWRLDQRQDDTRPQLFTKEEQAKIQRPQSTAKPRQASNFWGRGIKHAIPDHHEAAAGRPTQGKEKAKARAKVAKTSPEGAMILPPPEDQGRPCQVGQSVAQALGNNQRHAPPHAHFWDRSDALHDGTRSAPIRCS